MLRNGVVGAAQKATQARVYVLEIVKPWRNKMEQSPVET
jgi:hypothetical protein